MHTGERGAVRSQQSASLSLALTWNSPSSASHCSPRLALEKLSLINIQDPIAPVSQLTMPGALKMLIVTPGSMFCDIKLAFTQWSWCRFPISYLLRRKWILLTQAALYSQIYFISYSEWTSHISLSMCSQDGMLAVAKSCYCCFIFVTNCMFVFQYNSRNYNEQIILSSTSGCFMFLSTCQQLRHQQQPPLPIWSSFQSFSSHHSSLS